MENGGLVFLAGAAAFMALSDKLTEVQQRLSFGDIEIIDSNFHWTNVVISLEMPIRNLSDSNLSIDGLVGTFDFREKKVADVDVVRRVEIPALGITKMPIEVKINYINVIAQIVELWDELKPMIERRQLDGQGFITGKVFYGSVTYDFSQQVI